MIIQFNCISPPLKTIQPKQFKHNEGYVLMYIYIGNCFHSIRRLKMENQMGNFHITHAFLEWNASIFLNNDIKIHYIYL